MVFLPREGRSPDRVLEGLHPGEMTDDRFTPSGSAEKMFKPVITPDGAEPAGWRRALG
jgi:hypothetical protein